jgi:hydroxyacyl-ACP dehydratase HTD2-like protein with hotdog domain
VLIPTEIEALVGQEAIFQGTEPVDAGVIRRFAKSLGLEDARYYGLAGAPPAAPPTFVFSVNHDSLGEMDGSGRPANRLSLPPPFGPAIRGGNRYQFFRPVQVGDRIQIHRKITSLKEKLGRRGPMALLTYSLTYRNQNGDLMGINDETLIFLGPEDAGGKKKEEKPPESERPAPPNPGQEIPPFRVKVSKVQMMMYAAATWNPYQLHWDTDYARRQGFTDANVAGPMFAAYLAEMLARAAGGPAGLISLEYTNRAMAFPEDTLVCRGNLRGQSRDGNRSLYDCRVWTENQEGLLLVEGSAAYTRSG